MANFWHPTIPAYEVHGTRRISMSDSMIEYTRTVMVNANDADEFIRYILYTRTPAYAYYTELDDIGTGYLIAPYVRPQRATIIEDRAKYISESLNTEDEYETLRSEYDAFVEIVFTSDHREATTIFGQDVLVAENVTLSTEMINLDWKEFCWDEQHPLLSADVAPYKYFKTYKVDMRIERLRLDLNKSGGADAGTGTSDAETSVADLLNTLNGKVNAGTCYFHTFNTPFAPETILCTINRMTPTMYMYDGTTTFRWWTVELSFVARKGDNDEEVPTWNKFFRAYNESGTDKSGWYEIKHIKTNENKTMPVFKPYLTSEYVDDILRASPL